MLPSTHALAAHVVRRTAACSAACSASARRLMSSSTSSTTALRTTAAALRTTTSSARLTSALTSGRSATTATAAPTTWTSLATSSSGARAFASAGDSFTINIPPLGDSITEGTISEVLKSTGDAVVVDEVIAVIDTDKVSVEIRTPVAGHVEAWHADVNDNVEIDHQLVTIIVDESVTESTGGRPPQTPMPVASTAAASAANPPKPPVVPPPPPAKTAGRVPLIRFKYGPGVPSQHAAAVGGVGAGGDLHDTAVIEIPARYRRPLYDEAWCELIEMGGATPY